MTIEDLLNLRADDILKMTDAQLETILSPFFKFARPDPNSSNRGSIIESSNIPRPHKPKKDTSHKSGSQAHNQITQMLLNKARELGIDPTKL